MTVYAGIAGELPFLRSEAEALMVDTCSITVPDVDSEPVWSPSTGQYEQPTTTLYGPDVEPHAGKCKLRSPALVNPFTADSGPEAWQVEQSILSVPADAPAIPSGATVTYLTAAYNPNLPGRTFGVVGPHHESIATAQRLIVKEVVGVGGTGV